jgi:hypothetical protein
MKISGPAVRQHPGPGTELLSLDASRLSRSGADGARWRTGGIATDAARAATRGAAMTDADITHELVLAATARAALHRARDSREVPVLAILAHLGLARRSRGARHVLAALEALREDGAVELSRRHGLLTWSLSTRGERRLRAALRAGRVGTLPESPQHSAWRNARALAAQELERFHAALRGDAAAALALLDSEPRAPSDSWFELAARLQRACWLVGSASYCLYEWVEPDDAHADIDDRTDAGDEQLPADERARRRARRTGRRNAALWR